MCPKSCAKAVWPVAGSVSVGCLHGVTEAGHVQVAAVRPAGGDVADPGAYEHERAPAVREAADHTRPPADLAVQSFDHVVRADPPPMLDGIVVEQVGRGLADAFPEAGGGGLQPLGLHFGGDLFGLLQRGLPAFHGEHGLQGGRGPCRVLVADLGQDVAHEVDHAPLVARVRQHRVHGGDEPGAPVADHEPHAPETAFDHAPDELPRLALSSFMPSATPTTSRWPVSSTPMATSTLTFSTDPPHVRLSPHAVHEQVRVRVRMGRQGTVPPLIDVLVHAPGLVGERLGGHPLAPQQAAGVVDPALCFSKLASAL